MSPIIRYPRKGDPLRMYTPAEIAEATGIKYDMALWLCHTYGVKLRRRYYITMDQYDRAIKAMSAKEAKA